MPLNARHASLMKGWRGDNPHARMHLFSQPLRFKTPFVFKNVV